MRWQKLGLVYRPSGEQPWARKLTHIPTAFVRGEEIRVYFASLDEHSFGRIGYVDVAAENPLEVIRVSEAPVLDLGQLGAFDDSGVTPSCVLRQDDLTLLYYIGWQRAERVPYMLFSGLAVSRDGGETFSRMSRAPVLDRTHAEPFSRSAPCVVEEDGRFQVWYWSCEEWSDESGWVHYNNVIRHAESPDGVVWNGSGDVCIRPEGADYSVGRPWVIRTGDEYEMWFSIRSRSEPYRLGYARSPDGRSWERMDEELDLHRSPSGWDSEMLCYPCVVDAGRRRFLFYNGNGHGASGFGVAELVAP